MQGVNKGLLAYAVGMTAAVGAVLTMGAATQGERMDELTVSRLNIVERDGTLRMVISGRDDAPGIYADNQEYPHPAGRQIAGMLFYNQEGTEVGGLVFNGQETEGGDVSTGVSLTFDDYEQDQALALQHIQEGRTKMSGLTITDRPETRYDFARLGALPDLSDEERQAEIAALAETGMLDAQRRLFIGRTRDGDAVLDLRDADGRARIRMRVTGDGETSIAVLDEDGEIVSELAP